MVRYLISDLHLGHENIIEYCDRPFDTVDAMDETLIDNWNGTVDDEHDIVFFLGDLGAFADESELRELLDQLNGRVVFVEGNHDHPTRYVDGLNTHQYYIIQHGDRQFCCAHRPENVPRCWEGWILYGHHHDNDLDEYPFLDPERQRVNLSAELIGYEPLSLDDLVEHIDRGERIRRLR